mmetsp:Transcript_19261/g.48186  ORF Transcript_19261/g.48186 Transcript_19261/m.48186 type:complete len:213 (-) Transcript_19261:135-773(-)
MLALVVAFSAATVASADPLFPQGAAAAGQKLAQVLSSATSSSAYKQSIGDASANESAAVAAGTAALTEAVSSSMALDALKKDAFVAVHLAVRKQLYAGGCAKLYEGCPVGFDEVAAGCAPSASYGGFCGVRNFSAMNNAAKDDWAWRCGATWPCVSTSASYASACPSGWTSTAAGCEAPSSYGGICSPTTDFSGFSEEAKAKWAAMCTNGVW